jgi:hypothetical protein
MSSAEARLEIRTQVAALNDLQQRVFYECHAKCVPRPREGDLSVAEMVCIDRCVPKYLDTYRAVSKELEAARKAAEGVAAATAPKR